MENFEKIILPWQDWKIVNYLGSGAYGKVYEIERNASGIQEKAALKIVTRPKDAGELEADYQNGYDKESISAKYTQIFQEYRNEYKLMKELQGQSNIVSCDDFFIEENPDGIGGKIYIRMELLTSLQKETRERLLPEEEVIRLGKDICKALILCESRNIIHRDIKPDNVMISRFGDYKLGDFGVAKVMNHTTNATMTGTTGYIAPEVLHMEKYGKEVDIYSLGIVMYWLLNNRRMPFIDADETLTPFKANEALLKRYQGDQIPAPKNGSARLKEIVLKACEYLPKDRYASAQEMYDELDALQRGEMPVKNPSRGVPKVEIVPKQSDAEEVEQKPDEKKEKNPVVAEEKPKKKKSKKSKWVKIAAGLLVIVICGGLFAKNVLWKDPDIDYSSGKEDMDENGNVIRRTVYYKNGKTAMVYEFDEDGKQKKRTHYESDGKTPVRVYEYNENEEEIKEIVYEDGKVSESYTFEYDEKGNCIKTTEYDEKDNIKYVSAYEYDENGNVVKMTSYNSEGQVEYYTTTEYDSDNEKTKYTYYDSEGNVEEYIIYEKAEEGKAQNYTKYDADGNVIDERK